MTELELKNETAYVAGKGAPIFSLLIENNDVDENI